jgi:SNF2 family DNA or RNA helicase
MTSLNQKQKFTRDVSEVNELVIALPLGYGAIRKGANMNILEFPHVIDPFNHQLEHLVNHVEKKSWGLLWEQGTAKTKPIIDTAAYLYDEGKINALLVVAPPGVERNWNSDEIPKHMPPEFAFDVRVGIFLTAKKNTRDHKRSMEALIKHDGLAILLISYNAFMTKEGKAFIWKFLKARECLYVLDESHNIKTPSAKRTMSIVASGRYGKYKRILTGTPVAIGPFDLYSQIKFLDEFFWKNKGIHGTTEFRQFFGRWFTRAEHQQLHGYDPGYDQLIEYQNLDKLREWLSEISDRVLKDDVLDLPPKLYTKRYFEMSREQKVAYETLDEELMLEIGDNIITAELPIVKLLRFQQIACNYVPVGDDEPVHMFSAKNPRIKIMEDLKGSLHQPTIVWARFTEDVNQIMDLLGKDAVRYDGSLSDDEAERSKLAFQAGDAKWFVGTAQKGGPGLTLTQAKNMIYYSNSFRLIDRLQSEDRAHRAGMDEHPVNYIDIIASNTVDERIVDNLRGKRDIAQEIQGDEWKEWI